MAGAVAALMLLSGGAEAQTRDTSKPSASREQRLADGWSALAAGRAGRAAEIATALLKSAPRDHDAGSLAVAAGAALNATSSLDAYERWLGTRTDEDRHLLETVALAL
jgi:hypothetical protein